MFHHAMSGSSSWARCLPARFGSGRSTRTRRKRSLICSGHCQPDRERATQKYGDQLDPLRGAHAVLGWLLTHPGDRGQGRWLAADADSGVDWITTLSAGDPRRADLKRAELLAGVSRLLLGRVVLSGYGFLSAFPSYHPGILLFEHVEQVCDLICSFRHGRTPRV
jgi:hypothetical protein